MIPGRQRTTLLAGSGTSPAPRPRREPDAREASPIFEGRPQDPKSASEGDCGTDERGSVPAPRALARRAAQGRRDVPRLPPLHRNATQTVFGAGPARARVMLVGEQPGNEEDRAGAPFVGPAGRELDRALARAGIDRSTVY